MYVYIAVNLLVYLYLVLRSHFSMSVDNVFAVHACSKILYGLTLFLSYLLNEDFKH